MEWTMEENVHDNHGRSVRGGAFDWNVAGASARYEDLSWDVSQSTEDTGFRVALYL